MPSDIRDALKSAAGRPTKEVDMHAVWNRGTRLTWSRRIVAASMVVLVGLGAWAGVEAFGDGGSFDAATEPAAPNPLASICDEYQQRPELAIFLADGVSSERVAALSTKLAAFPGVTEVTYVSKREAFRDFKERYRDQPEFYESLPRDALPAYFAVRADDPDRVEEIATAIEHEPGVDEARYGGEIVERLCGDRAYQDLLRILCENPALLDELESDFDSEKICDLLQSPEP
jgi:hypothetical protein